MKPLTNMLYDGDAFTTSLKSEELKRTRHYRQSTHGDGCCGNCHSHTFAYNCNQCTRFGVTESKVGEIELNHVCDTWVIGGNNER